MFWPTISQESICTTVMTHDMLSRPEQTEGIDPDFLGVLRGAHENIGSFFEKTSHLSRRGNLSYIAEAIDYGALDTVPVAAGIDLKTLQQTDLYKLFQTILMAQNFRVGTTSVIPGEIEELVKTVQTTTGKDIGVEIDIPFGAQFELSAAFKDRGLSETILATARLQAILSSALYRPVEPTDNNPFGETASHVGTYYMRNRSDWEPVIDTVELELDDPSRYLALIAMGTGIECRFQVGSEAFCLTNKDPNSRPDETDYLGVYLFPPIGDGVVELSFNEPMSYAVALSLEPSIERA